MSPAWLAFLKRPTIENVQISPDGPHEYTNAGHGLMLGADKVGFYTRLLAFLAKHTQARTGAGARTADAQ
ncbi:hypothetical protein M8R20_32285 [Pseudomonas sp. R2.Fl]|nr:hypothetical protein [Pseudomonas sp. R2.Fl]